MIFGKKKIWEYNASNNKHFIVIFEIEKGILSIVTEGIAYIKGCKKALNFILTYSQIFREKIGCLLDNSKLHKIDDSTKILLLRFQEVNNIIDKLVTVGDNSAIKHFGQIYQHVFKPQFQIRFFKSNGIAVKWLKRDLELR